MAKNSFLYVLLATLLFNPKIITAQRVTIFGKAPVRIEGSGFLLEKMRKGVLSDDIGNCPRDKVLPIYLTGNWIAVQTTDSPFGGSINFSDHNLKNDVLYIGHYQHHQFYNRAYYTKTPITEGHGGIVALETANKIKAKRLLKQGDDIAYTFLKVNDFFFIDFFDYHTDTLVKRYYIKRLKVIPEIHGYQQSEDQRSKTKVPLSTVIPVHQQNKLHLQPDVKIRFILSNTSLPDSSVQYQLINLKTREATPHLGGNQVVIPGLEANSEYALELNYNMQPESVNVYYISTSAYWYQSTIFIIFVVIIVFVITVYSIISIFNKKNRLFRLKQAETERHLRTVQAQLNPHFTFNALSSIQGLINTGQIERANHYLQEFSGMLRQTLNRSQYVFNPLDQEINLLKTYIGLEQLRFNFTWDIKISPSMNLSEIEIPTLLLQPIVENAIKHGISELGSAGKIVIECTEGTETGSMMISIYDNGKGFKHPNTPGYGLKLTTERIEAMNSLSKDRLITLTFNNFAGTAAIFNFHNWIDN